MTNEAPEHLNAQLTAAINGKNLALALELNGKLLAMAPDNADLHGLRSIYLNGTGDHATALKAADRAIELDPKNPLGYFARAKTLYTKGKLKEADGYATKAIELAPNQNSYYQLWCKIAHERHDHEAAAYRVNEYLKRDPGSANPHISQAVLLYQTSEFQAAEKAARHALTIDPEHWEAHLMLALVFIQNDQPGDALEAAETAVRYGPTYNLAQNTLKKARQLSQQSATLDRIADVVCFFGTAGALFSAVVLFAVFGACIILAEFLPFEVEDKLVVWIPMIFFGLVLGVIEHRLKRTKPDPAAFSIDANY